MAASPLFAGPSPPDVNTVISTTIAEDFIDGGVFWTPATETSSFVMVVSIDSEAITGNASEVGIGKNTAWFGPQLCYYIEGELVVYMPKTTETCVTQFYCVNGLPSTLGINENDLSLSLLRLLELL